MTYCINRFEPHMNLHQYKCKNTNSHSKIWHFIKHIACYKVCSQRVKVAWAFDFALHNTGSQHMCHTETLPPPSPPVAARCQHGQCRLCQIPPSEINTRLPLLFQGNAFSHKVGWFTYTNPKSYVVNTYIQRDCFMLRYFTPLP